MNENFLRDKKKELVKKILTIEKKINIKVKIKFLVHEFRYIYVIPDQFHSNLLSECQLTKRLH